MKTLNRFLSFHSLQAKFLAITIPLVLLSIIALFAVIQLNAQRTANRDLNNKLQEVVAIQSASLAGPLWNIDEKQVSLILAAMVIDPEILGVVVYDETGSVIAEVGVMTAADQNVFVADAPIEFETETIGRLEVALTDLLVQAATRQRLQLAGGMTVLLLLSIVLSVLLAHRRTVGTHLYGVFLIPSAWPRRRVSASRSNGIATTKWVQWFPLTTICSGSKKPMNRS